MNSNASLFDTSSLAERAADLVKAAQKAGADAADAVVVRSQSLNVDVRLGKVEETDRSESDDFSLRVFVGQKSALVSANQTDDPGALAERAVAMAKVSPENPYCGLAAQDRLAKEFADLDMLDQTMTSVEELEQTARQCEDAAMAIKGITNSGGASASWGIGGMVLTTSHGFEGQYIASRFSRSISVVAGVGAGMERDYDYDSQVHLEDLRTAEAIGISAAERTIKRMNPRQVKTTTAPVMFDPRVSNSLVGHFASAINGASIARKTSFLREKMGEQIFANHIKIIDDPHIRRGQASRPFDGEGVVNNTLTLIDGGFLQCWLLDSATANELDLETNGRANRSGGGTSPGSTNLAMMAGELSPQEMMKNIGTGLYVTELIGQGVNLVSGDYSRGASGYWIENGEPAYPVSEITIAGNLGKMFACLVAANDLVYRYRTNAPTIMIEEMTIAGS
jgi:PmbA protein